MELTVRLVLLAFMQSLHNFVQIQESSLPSWAPPEAKPLREHPVLLLSGPRRSPERLGAPGLP